MMHDVVVVGIPLLAILAGILPKRNDVNQLRSEIRAEIGSLRSEMREGFGRIDADLRQFFHVTGKLEGRVDEIAKR